MSVYPTANLLIKPLFLQGFFYMRNIYPLTYPLQGYLLTNNSKSLN